MKKYILPKVYIKRVILGILLVISFVLGSLSDFKNSTNNQHENEIMSQTEIAENHAEWTCSMHPQIRQPKAGQCPICAMDLIPLESGSNNAGIPQITLSDYARKLAEIEVVAAEKKTVTKSIRLTGKVNYDETRVGFITAWVQGRLDHLYVDYTGTPVKKGAPLAELYSPDLLIAQQELIQAVRTAAQIRKSGMTSLKYTAQTTLNSAREKLRLWGLKPAQIATIEKGGKVSDHIKIYAPITGIVIHKNAVEGMYVSAGTKIYTIADLTHLWVELDAYESDLKWLKYDQKVEFEVEAYPGERFSGSIVYIDPVIDPVKRTAKIRVEVKNDAGRLKPEMFVRARVLAEPGDETDLPLVIPVTAPLITGRRAIVYIQSHDDKGVYTGREIVLGSRTDKFYVVREGLEEGELVVTKGNFKIDSAMQILAKPSMMSMNSDLHDLPLQFSEQIDRVLTAYFKVHKALSLDQFEDAKTEAGNLKQIVETIDASMLKTLTEDLWKSKKKTLIESAELLKKTDSIEKSREIFEGLSDNIYKISKLFGATGKQPVLWFFCPMAFNNKGAYWLQNRSKVENPYYGSVMYRCGEISETVRRLEKSDEQ